MGSREVNVGRPEHSWIPFYRELAEKLVNDDWRERQGELVGVLKEILNELETHGIPVPGIGEDLHQHVDPFTIFAVIARDLNTVNYAETLLAFKKRFDLATMVPAKPEIPYVDNFSVGFFGKNTDIESEEAVLWDVFELVLEINTFDDSDKIESLMQLIDDSLKIDANRDEKIDRRFLLDKPDEFPENRHSQCSSRRCFKRRDRREQRRVLC